MSMSVSQPVRVIYVAGYGRSGTTIFDIALGQHADVLGAGEITALTRHVWESNEYCACGCPIQSCELWKPVMQQWSESSSTSLIREYSKLQERFEGLAGLAKIIFGFGNGKKLEQYCRHSKLLFEEIISQSGRKIVVDSSKLPGRAMALSLVSGIDLHVIHVVRDGRGVAWSLLKGYERDIKSGVQREIKSKSVFRTAMRWSIVNLATELLLRKLGPRRFLRVRYEDFASNPETTLRQIGAFLSLDLSQTGLVLQTGAPMKPGHQLAGNRLRMNASIRLSKDDSWRSAMPVGQQGSFSRLCGWVLRRYGYL
jgi:Sulfotransferase family